jgi:hypothetical protein
MQKSLSRAFSSWCIGESSKTCLASWPIPPADVREKSWYN